MSVLNVLILAIVQGLAELLPVSSSTHMVVIEKLLGLDASAPPMTLLLVMLHKGTMLAVIVYFWQRWREAYFSSTPAFTVFAQRLVSATISRRRPHELSRNPGRAPRPPGVLATCGTPSPAPA